MVAEEQSKDVGILNIDVIDLEAPPLPLSQTAQALSIANFGAILKDAIIGNLDAIQHCINAAQTQGKSVWISIDFLLASPPLQYCVKDQN